MQDLEFRSKIAAASYLMAMAALGLALVLLGERVSLSIMVPPPMGYPVNILALLCKQRWDYWEAAFIFTAAIFEIQIWLVQVGAYLPALNTGLWLDLQPTPPMERRLPTSTAVENDHGGH